MNNANFKKWQYILTIVVIVLGISNPSRNDFNSFLHKSESGYTGRDFNGLIFSVYSKRQSYNGDGKYYIGILGNFIPLSS